MSARANRLSHTRTRPTLAMTLREHRKTHTLSAGRCCEVEDKLIILFGNRGQPLTELVEATAQAYERMDRTLAALPGNADPWVWPIFERERQLLRDLREKYPSDEPTGQRIALVLDDLSEQATVDEIAVGASKALYWAADPQTLERRLPWA